jgi:hypothetical protein
MQPIYTQTVGSGGASSVTFNNIPQGYQDLVILSSARDGSSANPFASLILYFNNDNNSGKYSETYFYGVGSTPATGKLYPENYFLAQMYCTTSITTSSTFANNYAYITNYSGGNYKSVISESAIENNSSTSNLLLNGSGLYRSNNPITSITITGNSAATIQQYSTFTLYGVSNQFAAQTPVAPTITSVVDQAGFASVNFLPTASDNATVYAVTDNNNNTTYGAGSPIVAPVTLGSNTTFTAKAINSLGTTSAAGTTSITSSNSFASIATVYSTSGGFNGTFTNIPQNYKHLQIRIFGRAVTAAGTAPVYLNINGDTGSNYSWNYTSGNGSSVTTSGAQSYADLEGFTITGSSATSNYFGSVVINILDYTDTGKYKTINGISGYDTNGSGQMLMNNGAWFSFAPISTINVQTYAGFVGYSHIALYGIA